PALVTALGDSDRSVRAYSLVTLSKLGEPAVPALVAALGTEKDETRALVGSALGKIGAPAVTPLRKALTDSKVIVRRAAVDALGSLGSLARPAVPDLVPALKDKDLEGRVGAAVALKRIDPAAAKKAGIP